jgi:hypothetical protein
LAIIFYENPFWTRPVIARPKRISLSTLRLTAQLKAASATGGSDGWPNSSSFFSPFFGLGTPTRHKKRRTLNPPRAQQRRLSVRAMQIFITALRFSSRAVQISILHGPLPQSRLNLARE